MSVHQVPQDVEVADKILGPLSLKQFIFAILFFGSCYIDYLFFKLFPLLLILVLPFTVVFGVLAFYQRSDQPVEVYLASALRFYFKPRSRIWNQEGYEKRVEITAPKNTEPNRTKDITQTEISSSLDNLAKVMDTHGWASKNIDSLDEMGVSTNSNERILNVTDMQTSPDFVDDSQINQQSDILDDSSTTIARQFGRMVEQSAQNARQRALSKIQESQAAASNPNAQVQTQTIDSAASATPGDNLQSRVIHPVEQDSKVAERINQIALNDQGTIASLAKEAGEIEQAGEIQLH
jgi:hypothetical protein